MKKENNTKSGFVAIVGRPNVGKSTLLNYIVDEKIAIVSKIPQTTRNRIRGIYTEDRGQIVFIDTPGIHFGRDKLDELMNQSSTGSIDDVDCLIYLVDTTRRIGQEEQMIADKLKDVKIPVIMGLNKIDVKSADVPAYIEFWENVKGKPVAEMENFKLIAMSGKNGTNLDVLKDVVFDFLPTGPMLYPEDTVTDLPQKMAIADIIREKLFMLMKDEIPHSIAIVIEQMRPLNKKTLMIKANIFVERPTQKEIVIGKKGNILKQVGTMARQELEGLLETKVYLELFVSVQKQWRDSTELLGQLGYTSL